jgi:hypothetical protein
MHIAVIIIFGLIFTSCEKTTTGPSGSYNVSGTVISHGAPVRGASVSLNKIVNYTTESDSLGHFSIQNVPAGDYALYMQKTNADGSYMEKTTTVSVTGDVVLQALILPRGVSLQNPANVTGSAMAIRWNPTDANDFREYKLFRHTTSGLDENTGTLVHVSTAINDTSFDDTGLDPLVQYYYRVYVMNEYGRLGGSNIVTSKTLNLNYLTNGGFENPTDHLTWWDQTRTGGIVSVTDSLQKEGTYSLQLISVPFSEYGITGERASIASGYVDLAEGDYIISFWVRVEGIPASVDTYDWWTFVGSEKYVAGIVNFNMFPIGIQSGSVKEGEWTHVEKKVRLLDYYYGMYGFYFEVRSFCHKAWFDDFRIVKAP